MTKGKISTSWPHMEEKSLVSLMVRQWRWRIVEPFQTLHINIWLQRLAPQEYLGGLPDATLHISSAAKQYNKIKVASLPWRHDLGSRNQFWFFSLSLCRIQASTKCVLIIRRGVHHSGALEERMMHDGDVEEEKIATEVLPPCVVV